MELTEEVTSTGLRIDIPGELVRELGWQPGQQVTIRAIGDQIAIAPRMTSEQRIQSRALAYLSRHVGDATRIGPVLQRGNRWEVAVYLWSHDHPARHASLFRQRRIAWRREYHPGGHVPRLSCDLMFRASNRKNRGIDR